jgi:hypothetical protein
VVTHPRQSRLHDATTPPASDNNRSKVGDVRYGVFPGSPPGPARAGAQPNEDVSHTDRGRIPAGKLVIAGGHRTELLAAVHQPLDLIALLVASPIERRRPPTSSTLAGPVGLLVIALRDGVRDVAARSAARLARLE